MDSGTGAAAWRSRAVCGTEYSWCRAAPGGTGTTLVALRLSRKGAAAEAAVRALQSAHPILRAHLRGPASSPTLAIPSSASQLRLAPQPSALDFDSLLEREINRNPWAAAASEPDGVPVLFAALYEFPPPAGGAALFVLIHTAVCDRASSSALLRELLALLSGAGAGDPDVKEESAAVEAGLEKRLPKKYARKPLWARGVDMVGYSINGLRTSTLPFEETGTARSTHMVRLRFGREGTTRLLDISLFEEPATFDMSDLQRKAGVEDYVCGGTVHGIGPSIALLDSIRDGELNCACMYPSPLHSRKQIQEVLEKVKLILHEGTNPSDEALHYPKGATK